MESSIPRRPSRVENEFDLLRQQEDFKKSQQHLPLSVKVVRKLGNKARNDNTQSGVEIVETACAHVVSDICEKNLKTPPSYDVSDWSESSGFPPLFDIDPNDEPDYSGQSLFLKQFPDGLMPTSGYAELLMEEIHKENLVKVATMSESEILAEQQRLLSCLGEHLLRNILFSHALKYKFSLFVDPALIKFLTNRAKIRDT